MERLIDRTNTANRVTFLTEDDDATEYMFSEGLRAIRAPYGDFTEVDVEFAQSLDTDCAAILLDDYFDTEVRSRVAEAALGILPYAVVINTGCREESLGRYLRRHKAAAELVDAVTREIDGEKCAAQEWRAVKAVSFSICAMKTVQPACRVRAIKRAGVLA